MIKEHVSFQVAATRWGIVAPVALVGLLSADSPPMFPFTYTWRVLKETPVFHCVHSHIPCIGRSIIAQGAIKNTPVPVVAFHMPLHSVSSSTPVIAGITFECFLFVAFISIHSQTAWSTGWKATLVSLLWLCFIMCFHMYFKMSRIGWNIIALVAFHAFVSADGIRQWKILSVKKFIGLHSRVRWPQPCHAFVKLISVMRRPEELEMKVKVILILMAVLVIICGARWS